MYSYGWKKAYLVLTLTHLWYNEKNSCGISDPGSKSDGIIGR
jgi:hypothetical protein